MSLAEPRTSLAALREAGRRTVAAVPAETGFVVAPRTRGMLAATLVAAQRGLPAVALESLEDGHRLIAPPRVAVVVDGSSDEVDRAVARLAAVDRAMEVVAAISAAVIDTAPRRSRTAGWTEWDVLHGPAAARCSFDIDGVLCADPTAEQDDDGIRYEEFLESVAPLLLPSVHVDLLVTARLERHRAVTEAWLARHAVGYRRLEMLDLPTRAAREAIHGVVERHKARAFARSRSRLFVESQPKQAKRIAAMTGRAVLCPTDGRYIPSRLRTRALARARWDAGRSG